MQIVVPRLNYQDRTHPPQVQAYLDPQWLAVRDFENL
jgi:hypothetical protein